MHRRLRTPGPALGAEREVQTRDSDRGWPPATRRAAGFDGPELRPADARPRRRGPVDRSRRRGRCPTRWPLSSISRTSRGLRGSFAGDGRVDVLLGDHPLIPVTHRGPGGGNAHTLLGERLDLPVRAAVRLVVEGERAPRRRLHREPWLVDGCDPQRDVTGVADVQTCSAGVPRTTVRARGPARQDSHRRSANRRPTGSERVARVRSDAGAANWVRRAPSSRQLVHARGRLTRYCEGSIVHGSAVRVEAGSSTRIGYPAARSRS